MPAKIMRWAAVLAIAVVLLGAPATAPAQEGGTPAANVLVAETTENDETANELAQTLRELLQSIVNFFRVVFEALAKVLEWLSELLSRLDSR